MSYLIAALQQADPGIGHSTQALVQSPEPPPAASVLTALINEITATSAPFILVLDDYHEIETLAIHQMLGFVLEHQPGNMHLVIASREDLPFPISRLRASGHVREMRQADLRFSAHETAEFLCRTMGLDLAADDIAVLERRTEGWVAGLQLAALSMSQHSDVRAFIRSFAGSDRYVLDYLFEEVIGQQPKATQELILKTSILDQRRGQVMTLLGWLQTLPDDVICSRPELCLNYGWVLILTGQLDQAERYLIRAEQAARDLPESRRDILIARAYLARARGEHRQAITLSQQALTMLPEIGSMERSMLALILGIAQATTGSLGEAERALRQAYEAAQESRNHYAGLTALGLLAALEAARGRLQAAAATSQQAIRLGGQLPATATAHAVLGGLLREWNDLDAASTHLEQGVDLCRLSGNLDVQIDCHVGLAYVRLAQGDAAAAKLVLDHARQLADDTATTPMILTKITACGAAIALSQEDLAGAERWAHQIEKEAGSSLVHSRLLVTPVHVLLAQQRQAAAATALESLFDASNQAGLRYVVVEIRALQAMAAPTMAAAMAYLRDALELAEPERYVRTFVDKGEPMAQLLRVALSQGIAPHCASTLLAAFDEQPGEQFPVAAPDLPSPDAVPGPGPSEALAEPPSERET